MFNTSLETLFSELESHCYTTAIVTFLNSREESFVIDIQRNENGFQYGYQPNHKAIFIKSLIEGCQPHGSIVLRSFTDEIDTPTKLPIKELRGYIIEQQDQVFRFEKIPSNLMFACQNTDAQTGEPLPLEQAVKYC